MPDSRRRIRILEQTLGNDPGDVVQVQEETEDEVYFYDSFGRWCYLPKSSRGILWEWDSNERT